MRRAELDTIAILGFQARSEMGLLRRKRVSSVSRWEGVHWRYLRARSPTIYEMHDDGGCLHFLVTVASHRLASPLFPFPAHKE